jgi:adenylate cyclase
MSVATSVIPTDLQQLADAGLHDPAAPEAGEREELLRHLLERFSVEEILYWSERTNMMGIAARAIDRPPPFVCAREAAEAAGVELHVVANVRAALGFPVLDADDRSIPETAVDDVETFLMGAELHGYDEALAFAGVVGWACSRLMEAARAMFAGRVDRLDSRSELELAKANELGALAWQRVQSLVVHVLAELPLRDTRFVEALLGGDLRVAVAFVDLVASTEWAQQVPPDEHAEALRRFGMQSARLAADRGARLVKLLGDEVMLVAEDPDALCRSALAVCAMAHDDPVLPDARGAVGFGAVTARDGDYVGPLVNTVARASKAADPGGIVVTEDVARALDAGRWSTDPLGPIALRGVRDAVALRRAVPRDENVF